MMPLRRSRRRSPSWPPTRKRYAGRASVPGSPAPGTAATAPAVRPAHSTTSGWRRRSASRAGGAKGARANEASTAGVFDPASRGLSARATLIVPLFRRLLGGDAVGFIEPAAKVDIGATRRAERLVGLYCRLPADRTA